MEKKNTGRRNIYYIYYKYMEINFDNTYLSGIDKCNFLQRYILVHSIIYYVLDTNVVTDKQYDRICRQLLKLSRATERYNTTEYYYVFSDFSGVTGFDLYYRLNEYDKKYLLNIARNVVKQYNNGNRNGK